MNQIIREAMEAGIALRQSCLESLESPLLKASERMVACLQNGGKILVCGNGGSAADAQHFAGELVNRFEMNRRGLAAIAMTHDASVITSIANDFSFDDIFSRQVEALGRPGDLLLAISTSGDSANVLKAIDAAKMAGMESIALTGKDGGLIGNNDSLAVHINIAHPSTPRVQEMHITCLHILCSLVDEMMFGINR
ncbi:MAG TPA: D-sedoheptulose 7-phosphate isomerase [Mariprofundaceae bacterium]|nr:D-sedoheptulose 7-phosphate isomerase [Mariprofundaceae bacterium]